MRFLSEVLGRPTNEHPFLILAAGHPAENARVPHIGRNSLAEVGTFV